MALAFQLESAGYTPVELKTEVELSLKRFSLSHYPLRADVAGKSAKYHREHI